MRFYVFLTLAGVIAIAGGCGTVPVKTNAGMPSGSWVDQQHQDFSAIAECSVTQNGVQVYLGGDLLFRVGRSKLSADGIQKIDSIAMVLKKYPKDQVLISVFTDNSGKPARNLKLTQRRANSIKTELVKQGIKANNISAVGKGDSQPIAGNDTDENRAKNRRAEFDITLQ